MNVVQSSANKQYWSGKTVLDQTWIHCYYQNRRMHFGIPLSVIILMHFAPLWWWISIVLFTYVAQWSLFFVLTNLNSFIWFASQMNWKKLRSFTMVYILSSSRGICSFVGREIGAHLDPNIHIQISCYRPFVCPQRLLLHKMLSTLTRIDLSKYGVYWYELIVLRWSRPVCRRTCVYLSASEQGIYGVVVD